MRTINHRSSPWGISGMGMLPRKSFDLGAYPAGQHECDHLVIAHEGPERVFESRGPVLFDQKVGQPRAAVTRKETKKEQPPLSDRDYVDQQSETRSRAD